MMSDRKILIIYTGGTIGMINDVESNSLVPFDFNSIQKRVPEIKQFDFDVDVISFDPLVDSSDMTPQIWGKIANHIEVNYEAYSGFVVLHGTDTMAYTASALSFMFSNLQKAIVLTGSQLPIGTIRNDGKENLIAAIEIAAAHKNGKSLVPEVCIYFQDKLFRGNRTTKFTAEHFRGFRCDNYPPLAEVGINIKYNFPFIRPVEKDEPFRVDSKMDDNVNLIRMFPGINRQVIRSNLRIPGLRGVVLETYGSGNAPTSPWFLEEIEHALNRGVVVLNVTQCLAGSVEMWRYETGVHLLKLGVISGHDLSVEAALTKLMYLLANCPTTNEVKSKLNKSLRGEIYN